MRATPTARHLVPLAPLAVLLASAGCNNSAASLFGCPDAGCGTSPTSCAAILAATPGSADGTYMIDPDGAGGTAPFSVWCDMTTDGGGWTALPLRFANPTMWSVTHSGTVCTSDPMLDDNGTLLSFKNTDIIAGTWSYLSMQFVPPIPVTTVWLKSLTHSTSTMCNNMDILYTVEPSTTGDDTAEGWYFVDSSPTTPLAYTFTAGCDSTPHYTDTMGTPPECQMDTVDDLVQITHKVSLGRKVAHLRMVAVEGCGSNPPCDVTTGQAERFYIKHPATAGLWKDGILVR